MAILTINGAEMPSPGELNISYKPEGKAEISAAGTTVMDRLSVRRTISATFRHLTTEGAELLLQSAIQTALFFDLQYYDPMTGQTVTGTFRATSCSLSPLRYSNGVPTGYVDGKLTMEER